MTATAWRSARATGLPIVLCALVLFATGLAVPREAKAIGIAGVPYPSFVMRQECVRTGLTLSPICTSAGYSTVGPPFWTPSRFVVWEWDPPEDVTSINFSFYFNPSLFTPVLGSAGFLCGFTTTGNCPVESPGVGTQPISFTANPPTPGPATGTQSITIGSDTVSIAAIFSPATPVSSDGLFFAMDFTPNFNPDDYNIEYSTGLLPGADYYVMSYSCTTADGTDTCGSQNFTQSFRVVPTDEPAAIGLLVLGALGAVLVRRRSDFWRAMTQSNSTLLPPQSRHLPAVAEPPALFLLCIPLLCLLILARRRICDSGSAEYEPARLRASVCH
jgi:hypothetical protein